MKLEWLYYFNEVAKTNSISKAAQNLYVTQPAVSKMIQALEKETGEVLLIRTPFGVTLTQQGELLQKFGQEVLCAYNNYLRDKSKYQNETADFEGTLELALSPLLLQTYYKIITEHIKRQFPRLNLRIIEADIEAIEKLVLANGCVLGLSMYPEDMLKHLEKGLVFDEIYASNIIICTSKNSRYAKQNIVRYQDIPPEKIISVVFAKKKPKNTDSKNFNFYTTNLEVIRQKLLTDDEVCVMIPQFIAERKLFSPHIVQLIEANKATASVGVLYNATALDKAVYSPTFLKAFAHELTKCLLS